MNFEQKFACRYVLVSAGNIKRERLARDGDSSLDDVDEQKVSGFWGKERALGAPG